MKDMDRKEKYQEVIDEFAQKALRKYKDDMKKKIQERYRKPIEEFVKKALERYEKKIERIILFGSVARGEGKEDSDIDILIVVKEEDFRLRRALIGIAFDILLGTGNNISVKVLSKKEFEGRGNFSFLRNIILEGVKLA